MSRSSRLSLGLMVALAGGGCFDDPAPSGDETESSASTESTGDGDGDPATGDGDGDGDPTTTGDGDGDGDPTTTGDGDGDPTTGDGDGDEEPCGNGRLDAGEICDDGSNLGVEEGDCAPDCSAVVVTRRLILSEMGYIGNFANQLEGAGDLPEFADDTCPIGFKAMFTYGGVRTASLTPFVGDGQVDWVLRPWTRYEREDGTWVGSTDGTALLGVRDGAWYGLEAPIDEELEFPVVWTGMNANFTTVEDGDEVCESFTSIGLIGDSLNGWTGDASRVDLDEGENYIQAWGSCFSFGRFYCAEQ